MMHIAHSQEKKKLRASLQVKRAIGCPLNLNTFVKQGRLQLVRNNIGVPFETHAEILVDHVGLRI